MKENVSGFFSEHSVYDKIGAGFRKIHSLVIKIQNCFKMFEISPGNVLNGQNGSF